MNCERAEEELSAFLDDALDSQLHSEIQAHLDGSARCRAELDDFRRFDRLIAELPRVEPPAELRARIFASEEYRALLAELDREPVAVSTGRHRAPPAWARIALPAAAVVLLALGGALLALHPSAPAGQTSGPGTSTIGNPGHGAPLSAGPRAIYEHDGALWSAPENGPGLAQQLTPDGVRVAGWSVAPVTGDTGGRLITYVDARTGAIHVLRSDRQSDHVIGQASASTLLVWAPDASRIAYVTAGASGATTLRIMNADGTNDHAITDGAHGAVSAPVWSIDSLRLAFTQANGGLWSLEVNTGHLRQVATQADAADAQAVVSQLAWLPDAANPGVTWVARDGGTITGLYLSRVLGNAGPQQLASAAAHLSAAEYTSASGGTWLAASGADLYTISAQGNGVAKVGTAPTSLPTAVGRIAWSPDGHSVAYATSDTVVILRLTSGGVSAAAPPIHVPGALAVRWAPDGQSLVVASSGGVLVVAGNGSAIHVVDMHPADGALLAWSVAG